MELKKSSPIYKKIILAKKYPRCYINREIETFCWTLNENSTGSQNFRRSKRIQNSISSNTFSVKNSFPTNRESRRGRIGESGSEIIEEESHRKNSTIKKVVSKQLILFKKERWRPKIRHKSETTECLYPYCYLK